MSRALALLPALLLASFAGGLGNLLGATHAWNFAIAGALLLALAPLGAPELPDPLRLGRWGRLLVPLVLGIIVASLWASPVPRAGSTAVVLLPAFLLLPSAVARLWSEPAARRLGVGAWSLAVAAIALFALADADFGASRAALPLGHHNLLGAFLVLTVPVAMAGLVEGGWVRWTSITASVTGVWALFATRSSGALIAAAVVGLLAARRLERSRLLVAGLGLLVLGLSVPRFEAILAGRDSSAAARRSYAEAAWAGARERPMLGWGPGSVSWTLAGFMAPRPGANPPGELVGEPHSTPLRLLYELGALGSIAIGWLALRFGRQRWRELRRSSASPLQFAACGAVAGGAIASLSGSWLAIPALPMALALVVGTTFGRPAAVEPRQKPWLSYGIVAAYMVAAGLLLTTRALAHGAFEAAQAAGDSAVRSALLQRAVDLDPAFPLYRARVAWESAATGPEVVLSALTAATAARGVGPLWLKAATMAIEAGDFRRAHLALERAMALDPLSGTAPFLLFVISNGAQTDCAARALIADPRLAAATFFRGREESRLRAVALVERWPGLDLGWRSELARQVRAQSFAGEPMDLVFRIDSTPALAASLHLFRRAPWVEELARIRVDRGALGKLRLPSAAALALHSSAAFPPRRCRPE